MDLFDRRRRHPGRLRDRELPVLDFPITPASSTAPSRWGRYRQILDDLFLSINDDGGNAANKQRKRCRREKEPVESIISACQILDAAGLQDGDHLNLLDWSPSRNLAIVLDDVVHSLNPGTSAHEIVFDYMGSSISSLSWAPDGRHLAVGMHDSLIYIWDVERKCPTRTLRNVHWRSSRVGSLAWKCDNILTSGGSDGRVVNSDPRMPSAAHVVQSYRGHGPGDICGLKWSPDHASFKQLASGGSDGLVHVWDARNQNQWAFRFKVAARDASVRALDWCPFKGCLLATGGGVGGDGKSNGSIRFWSTQTGACVRSVKTGSTRVCALMWSKNSEQFLSSCSGTDQDHMTLWDYPSCVRTGELVGHVAPYLALSPDGTTVASASGGIDSTLRLWNIFPPVPKPTVPFSGSYHAHIRIVSY
ncbi:cell division cycle 20.5, cofactor of APC complex-like isoform X2 [Asparagus officinalis]|uniref:cell division cycle 20.5, cofactor of APC complex-like isoform X1 n=1 Tax=Asparagus officinalis TaxID=4686 RepID=UPI00098E6F6B|nr:cell division cycle 20.5, cofactor of APC complex-like isoform X1 [Asparagus officinalis]XP_020247848.1 cell division cycle 20.5, cofactor of APC complex-like isoform X2 [Asparagus officinalis]